MTRFVPLSLILLGLFIASVGCGEPRSTVIEAPANYQPSDTELEMQTEDYEKAMNELNKNE